jgi:uncharacterized membrane protein SpoIIM required for sporulation
MLPEEFIQLRRPSWQRLTQLIEQAQGVNLRGLGAEELQELGRLYRLSTSDLAVARRDFPSHQVTGYLNDLVARGHGVVYREGGARGRHILSFFSTLVPRTFRATWPFSAVAALMFFLPALISFVLVRGEAVEPGQIVPGIDHVLRQIRDGEEWWLRINEEGRAASSSFIMTNNIRVAFIAFAGGMTFGLLTIWTLLQNGLLLGTISGAAALADFADNLWGFVTAHAPVELSVICIAGGAGLQMGWAIFRPGLHTRRAALTLAARRALILIGGCVPLLVLAGLIEGFVSPAPLPFAVKLAVALLSGGAMFAWLLLSGRALTPGN